MGLPNLKKLFSTSQKTSDSDNTYPINILYTTYLEDVVKSLVINESTSEHIISIFESQLSKQEYPYDKYIPIISAYFLSEIIPLKRKDKFFETYFIKYGDNKFFALLVIYNDDGALETLLTLLKPQLFVDTYYYYLKQTGQLPEIGQLN